MSLYTPFASRFDGEGMGAVFGFSTTPSWRNYESYYHHTPSRTLQQAKNFIADWEEMYASIVKAKLKEV
jgi:hypothetical protein